MQTQFVKTFSRTEETQKITIHINKSQYEYERGEKPTIKVMFSIYPYEDKYFFYMSTGNKYINSLHKTGKQTIEEIKKYIYSINHYGLLIKK